MTRAAVNIAELRQRARQRLPRLVFEYLDGGAEDELSLRANRQGFDDWRLQPRLLRDVSERSQTASWWGRELPSPMAVAPIGLAGVFWPKADIAVAQAAAAAGLPYILSTASNSSIEEVADQAGGDLWFQLYVINRSIADGLVRRALAADYRTLVLTIDVAVGGKRERDLFNGFTQPFRLTPRVLWDMARRPHWLSQNWRGAPQLANLVTLEAPDAESQAALVQRRMDASYDWEALQRLREMWPHRLVVKGILHADDARRAFELGCDGVVLSNHGGRQLDGAVSALDVLPQVAKLANRGLVLLDGGVRRGSDVLKARALGADGVLLGRAAQFGVASGGREGAARALAILRDELDRTMALAGVASLDRIPDDLLRRVNN
ncbi:MAG: alpha-hydroxy-acid oxidizing protein [Pigmentiphaga sp.]